jgi:hypothetical protein
MSAPNHAELSNLPGIRIDACVEQMKHRGSALHVYYTLGKPVFMLGDTRVPDAIGYALAKHPNLVATDLALIADGLPQTFRYAGQ